MEPRRRFRFLKAISEGSFGKVYLAEMVTGDNFSTVVAIKLLHGKWLGHEEIVMRSRDEARLLGLLRHQNIVRVEDLSSINGQCAVIMEYLEGVDLKHMVTFLTERGEIFPRRAAIEAAAAIASALDAAYNHRPLQGGKPLRVIHRDIKPSNAMITSAGQVKVLDFGTARANFEDREAETQALAFGSQAYMAPERMMGDPDTPAADVFSLGITLWEILAGDRFGKIFIREARYQTALEQRVAQLDFSMLDDQLAEQLRELLLQMMEYEATARPTAAEVMEKLEEYAERASDMGLRRLCRQHVKEAMGVREPQEVAHDPLTGTTLVEDRSSAFVRGPNGQTWSDEGQEPEGSSASLAGPPAPAADAAEASSGSWLQDAAIEPIEDDAVEPAAPVEEPPAPEPAPLVEEPAAQPEQAPPPAEEPAFEVPPDLADGAEAALEPPAEEPPAEEPSIDGLAEPGGESTGSQPMRALDTFDMPPDGEEPSREQPLPGAMSDPPPEASGPVVISGPVAEPEEPSPTPEPQPSSGSKRGLGLVFMFIGLIAVVVVGGGIVAVLFFMKPDTGGSTVQVTPPPQTDPVQVTPDPPSDPAQGKAPGPITIPGDSVGVASLVIKPPAGGAVSVTITSTMGYKQSWEGVEQLEFEKIPAGTYRTKATPTDGVAIRSAFDVLEGKTCSYTLDLAGGSEEWSGGCE
jgi:serine/threonine protein kinase